MITPDDIHELYDAAQALSDLSPGHPSVARLRAIAATLEGHARGDGGNGDGAGVRPDASEPLT